MRIIFCVILTYIACVNVLAYTSQYTKRPLNGFYCPNGLLRNISGINQQLSTRHCLFHQACKVLSYNQNERFCVLGEIACSVADSDPNYMLMVFRPNISEDCSIWKPTSNPLSSRTVDRQDEENKKLCCKNNGTNIYFGHCRTRDMIGKFVANGKLHKTTGTSVLTVNHFCTLAWISYISGSTLPENAIRCGQLTDEGSTYCTRIWQPGLGRMFFGYYSIGDRVAEYAFSKVVRESKSMEILIQV